MAIVGQDIDQTAQGGGAQTARNEVDQDADARAKTVQLVPINANLPTSGGARPRSWCRSWCRARGARLRLWRQGPQGRWRR